MVTNALLAAKENTPYLPRHRVLRVPKVTNVRLKLHFQIHVAQILTNARQHPHGIKVRLKTGEVGRVRKILVRFLN